LKNKFKHKTGRYTWNKTHIKNICHGIKHSNLAHSLQDINFYDCSVGKQDVLDVLQDFGLDDITLEIDDYWRVTKDI
jgi:hypothetical protein